MIHTTDLSGDHILITMINMTDTKSSMEIAQFYSLCYSPDFRIMEDLGDRYLMDWNNTIMDSLLSKGCNCNSIQNANDMKNLVCPEQRLKHAWWVQFIYIFLFSSIILLSIIGNVTVIWIVVWHRRMRASITNYFLLNLAVSDASISVFNVCFSFTFNLYYDWFFGSAYCTFNNFMGVVPTSASVFTLMTMSLDRYVAIVYPLKRRLSRAKTMIIIACIWVASAFSGLPMLLFSRTVTFYFINGEKDTACLSDHYPDGDARSSLLFMIYNYFLFSVHYVLPLAVLSFTYIRMSVELWGSQRIGDYRHEESMRAKRKVVKMMVTVVSIFMFCWFPYHAYFTILSQIFADLDAKDTQHVYLNMYFLAMSSTIFNPMIYIWMNSRFRIGFKYAFRWLPCVKINADEYLESDLHRDRINLLNSTATCRRRSTATCIKHFANGNVSPQLSSAFRTTTENHQRRNTSVCTQLSHAELADIDRSIRCEQQIALLQVRRNSFALRLGKKKRPQFHEDVAV